MRYSIGLGPVRVYGGHGSKQRSMKATPATFFVWLVLCLIGIVILGVCSHSAAAVIGAILAVIFVTVKILGQK